MRIDECRAIGCTVKIIFLFHSEKSGKIISTKANPVEFEPHENGNLVVDKDRGIYRMATLEEKELAKCENKKLYISHFATCKFRGQFRKEK